MSEHHLEPAKTVIAKMGGVDAVASVTGKHVSRVYRWMYPKNRGGTDGYIPPKDAGRLLQDAASRGLDLKASDFFDRPGVAA